MNPSEASFSTQLKVGVFTVLGLFLIGAITVFVNDRPHWWRNCQLVHINVEDATGLKTKSPVRSLGLEIGYIRSVLLSDTHVDLGICITEKVDVLPTTRAYIRGEGFLGDKFVELKPVRYVGPGAKTGSPSVPAELKTAPEKAPIVEPSKNSGVNRIMNMLIPSALAEEPVAQSAVPAVAESAEAAEKKSARQIPVGEGSQDVQNLVKRVDSLVGEMTNLTTHLKQAINPEELRSTMHQLNRTLENASRTLSPESGLNQTAQRTLAKLEDAIEQLRDMATRVNQGQGSIGMLINDPTYAEELRTMARAANKLLNKVNQVRFVPDVGGEKIQGYGPGRGWFRLGIWPKQDRYYLLGISLDPRGGQTIMRTTTSIPGGAQTIVDTNQVEQTRLLLTAMFGKVFYDRLDLAIGALNGDGAVSAGVFLGPKEDLERFQFRTDVYSRGSQSTVDARFSFIARVFMGAYVRVGLESTREVNGLLPFSYGAGVSFDDEDIKLLFTLR
jgi:phospholipid/cholesterol/gamma-HCH transport system substrate-binding protein